MCHKPLFPLRRSTSFDLFIIHILSSPNIILTGSVKNLSPPMHAFDLWEEQHLDSLANLQFCQINNIIN